MMSIKTVFVIAVILGFATLPSEARFRGLVRAGGKLIKEVLPDIIQPIVDSTKNKWAPWTKWNEQERMALADEIDAELMDLLDQE
uniref:Antimicrobial peptide n=2 Tax=Ciona intestinalis TaxID=7719 RepID=F6Q8Y9_CIOIN